MSNININKDWMPLTYEYDIIIDGYSLKSLGIPYPTTIDCSINKLKSTTSKNQYGTFVKMTEVNSIGKVVMKWDYLEMAKAKKLFELIKVDLKPKYATGKETIEVEEDYKNNLEKYNQSGDFNNLVSSDDTSSVPYIVKEMDELIIPIQVPFPTGLRYFNCYIGDTIDWSLQNNGKGLYITDLSISFIGIGD